MCFKLISGTILALVIIGVVVDVDNVFGVLVVAVVVVAVAVGRAYIAITLKSSVHLPSVDERCVVQPMHCDMTCFHSAVSTFHP